MNPLHGITKLGQSVWYDNIHRAMLNSGELAQLINDDGLRGVTSNPSIFEKAITSNNDYDQAIESYIRQHPNATSRELFYHLAIDDIQKAADLLMPVYKANNGHDGLVSLEVSPDLAHDTEATIKEAKELWLNVNRPNLMIKVPATKAGIPVIEALIADGINVNATLLFSVSRYEDVAHAYIAGLETRLRRGQPIDHVASVASFFVSRVDSAVDTALSKLNDSAITMKLSGKLAIANAKLAYQSFQNIYAQANVTDLISAGAKPQRLLWASTGTKSKTLSDILYLETLIGPNTVTTVPPATYSAYRDHGKPQSTLADNLNEAISQFEQLKQAGIDIDALTNQLEIEGVTSFANAFTTLLAAIDSKVLSFTQKKTAVV